MVEVISCTLTSKKKRSPDVQTELDKQESTTLFQTPEQVLSKKECLQSLEKIIESNLKTFYQVASTANTQFA